MTPSACVLQGSSSAPAQRGSALHFSAAPSLADAAPCAAHPSHAQPSDCCQGPGPCSHCIRAGALPCRCVPGLLGGLRKSVLATLCKLLPPTLSLAPHPPRRTSGG